MKVDRTYRTNPAKYRDDLKQEIINEATEQWERWERRGKLPIWMRLKKLRGWR